jgi:hypothetical protein
MISSPVDLSPMFYSISTSCSNMIALSGSFILLGICFAVLFWLIQVCICSQLTTDLVLLTSRQQIVYRSLTSPLKNVPGPWISRYTNLQLKFAVTGGRRIFYIDDLHKKYGPIVRISPTEVAVADPPAFKQIHAVSSKFTKDIWYEKLTNFPRLSVFTIRNPREHGQRRKLFARGFSKTYLREHWEPTVRKKTLLAVEKIKIDAQTGVADLLKWWTFMATDIVGILGFGESFGMLELGKVDQTSIPRSRNILTENLRKPNTSECSKQHSSATALVPRYHGSVPSEAAYRSNHSRRPSTQAHTF